MIEAWQKSKAKEAEVEVSRDQRYLRRKLSTSAQVLGRTRSWGWEEAVERITASEFDDFYSVLRFEYIKCNDKVYVFGMAGFSHR